VIAQARYDLQNSDFYAYSPYGEVAVLGPDEGNPLRYTGREDDGTGLYYYRARYYDPGLKRFISEDPIGIEEGLNLAAYVGGNPVNRTDPLGLFVPPPPLIVVAAEKIMSVGTAVAAIVASVLVSGDTREVPISITDLPANDCPFFPDDADCAKRKAQLEAERYQIIKLLQAGYRLADKIRRYKFEAKNHNLLCPKFKVDENI
jgi:RHS repeat-associated protein